LPVNPAKEKQAIRFYYKGINMSQQTSSRRNFIKTAMAAGTAALILPSDLLASSQAPLAAKDKKAPTLKGKKVVFVHGGWEGHDPVPTRDLFVPWMQSEGAEVTVSDNLDIYLNQDLMNSLDLVVQIWTMGTITNEQEKGLLQAIKNGAGLAGWHGGIGDSFRNNVEYQFMVGGQWVSHPGGVIDYKVNIIDRKDPITKGMKDFAMHSEQYYMHVDPNMNVLATTRFTAEHAPWIDGCTMPVVWKKYYGKGRVFYSSLGHVIKDFEGPEVLEIQKRGIRWASESKYHPFEEWRKPMYKI
jgi:uncharacterized protein